jgi:hypothetical protein
MINKFEDEISICPEHSVPLKDGAVNWFIHGTETKAGVIDPLCQKHGLEYEVKLSGERKDQLTAIILYGQVLEKPQIEELVHSACWAFKRALEPRTS